MTDLRASDADRELIADGLRAHHAVGRLDHEELEERLAVAFAARTQGELTRLVADLPPPEPAPRPAEVRHDPWSGAATITCDGGVDRAWQLVAERAVPSLVGDKYLVVDRRPHVVTLERDHRPWWVWLIVVFTFPVGLLALLIKEKDRALVSVEDAGAGRARISVTAGRWQAARAAIDRLGGAR